MFASKNLWLPPGAAAHTGAVDRQFLNSFLWLGAVFAAAQIALGMFVWRYRDRGQAAAPLSGDSRAEALWTAAAALLFFGLNVAAMRAWEAPDVASASEPVRVEVTGVQFAWYFHYPGPDGKLGSTSTQLIDASAGTRAAIGLVENETAAKDDAVTTTLVLPVDQPVVLSLKSQDVIHDLFIREMRLKQDAVPGLVTTMRFTPTQVGDFEMTCAELCGLGHHRMRAVLRVVSTDEYQQWLAGQVARQ